MMVAKEKFEIIKRKAESLGFNVTMFKIEEVNK